MYSILKCCTGGKGNEGRVEWPYLRPFNQKGYEMDTSNLTPEQIEKLKACETPEELHAMIKSEGIKLTSEQLQAISGGSDWASTTKSQRCPSCRLLNWTNSSYRRTTCEGCGAELDPYGWQ